MHRFLHRTLVIVCILFAVGLLLTYLSVYINPDKFWLAGLLGLAYPFLLIINLFFLVYWVIRWKRLFLIPLFTILLGTSHLLNFIQLPSGKTNENLNPSFNILSYNVNLFRLYSWSNQTPSFSDISAFIKEKNVDIACFQEFFVVEGKLNEKTVNSELKMNSHIEYVIKSNSTRYGIATYSKFPIVGKGVIPFENTANACIYTNIRVGVDTIRVYNCHLQSLKLKERNLSFLLNQNHKSESNIAEIKEISFKFRDAFKMRDDQVRMILDDVKKCPYPMIICGDFNDSPISFTYHEMTKNMLDSFKEVGKGFANTYVRFFPYRIDYILHCKDLKAINFSSPRVDFSDHYPVLCSFELTNEAN